MQTPARVALLLVPALLLTFACIVPVRDYSVDEIASVGSLDELMDVQATVAEPRFDLADERSDGRLTDAEFAEFEDLAVRLAATARRIPEFATGDTADPGFVAYARTLEDQATELGTLVSARDGTQVVALALAIETTCKDCHWDYR